MTEADRILAYVAEHPEGVSRDQVAAALGRDRVTTGNMLSKLKLDCRLDVLRSDVRRVAPHLPPIKTNTYVCPPPPDPIKRRKWP